MDKAGRRIEIRGNVQGVGFRPWVYRIARQQGIAGRVRNDARVVVVDAFVAQIETPPPPATRIRELRTEAIPAEPARGFRIVQSVPGGARRVMVPPDLAPCPDCEREIFDPADRRHGYAFTNCTNCGPRFSILRYLPYDRASTTMARLQMCPAARTARITALCGFGHVTVSVLRDAVAGAVICHCRPGRFPAGLVRRRPCES